MRVIASFNYKSVIVAVIKGKSFGVGSDENKKKKQGY
ncbi:hypothetical protein YBT020_23185 [Bacillus thuringiensis serovar finitimus YBT-020]|nr:hypothetical protein YBT020_23185 [Bacillus thuringiensis serovar finitimus YBT-020]